MYKPSKEEIEEIKDLQRKLGLIPDGIAGYHTIKVEYKFHKRKMDNRNKKINIILDDKA